MPFDERKTFAATKEDLEQNTADILVAMQQQVLVIQKAPRAVDVPLLQYIDTTVDVPVAKQHEDCMTKHNEIEMDKKLRSAQFRTESKKQIVFDSEGPSDLRFEIRCKQGSRVVRCATLTTSPKTVCSQTKLTLVSWRSLRAIPQERVEQRIVERNVDVPVPGACPQSESSNRSSMCLCHCRFWKRSSAVVTLVPHERVRQRTVEQIVHVPVTTSRGRNSGSGPDHFQERISKRITDRLVDVPGCEAAPSIAHPDSAKDVGSSSSAALGCDADPAGAEDSRVTAASVQRQSGGSQLCNREQMPPMQFVNSIVDVLGRDAEADPSPESSEGDRDSTRSAP